MLITSDIPTDVELTSAVFDGNSTVIGNIKLLTTLTIADKKVFRMYKNTTSLNFFPILSEALATEQQTSKNTKTGAIAFIEPTNKTPKESIMEIFLKKIPKIAPNTKPIIIRTTKFISQYFFINFSINYILHCLFLFPL